MQGCDFCDMTEKASTEAGHVSSVRRLRLELKDHDDPRNRIAWWILDLCMVCRKQFKTTLDNLVLPEVDEIPKVKKGSNFAFNRIEEEIKVKTPKK